MSVDGLGALTMLERLRLNDCKNLVDVTSLTSCTNLRSLQVGHTVALDHPNPSALLPSLDVVAASLPGCAMERPCAQHPPSKAKS